MFYFECSILYRTSDEYNEEELACRWDICINSMRKMTENFMRMREYLGESLV